MEKRETPLLSSAMVTILLINSDSSVLVRYVMGIVAGVFLGLTVYQIYKRYKSIKELPKHPIMKA